MLKFLISHLSMSDPGFFRQTEGNCHLRASELASDEDSKPAARSIQNARDDFTLANDVARLQPNLSKLKRSSSDIAGYAHFLPPIIDCNLRQPTIRELQNASNAKKRRRRSGQQDRWNLRLEELRQYKSQVQSILFFLLRISSNLSTFNNIFRLEIVESPKHYHLIHSLQIGLIISEKNTNSCFAENHLL